MVRTSRGAEKNYDPEIVRTEKGLRRIVRLSKLEVGTSSEVLESDFEEELSEILVENTMAAPRRTLRERLIKPMEQKPMCISYPDMDTNFEVKGVLLQMLPMFRGLDNEDPHKHLREVHVACTSYKPQGILEEHIKLRVFPFTLRDDAKEWLYYLPEGSVRNWEDMVTLFLGRYFTPQRASHLKRQIQNIKQKESEPFHQFWERFNKLLSSFPNHGIDESDLIHHLYEGLREHEREMVDVSSGGALLDLTYEEAIAKFKTMSENSKLYGSLKDTPKRVQEAGSSTQASMQDQMNVLTSMMHEMHATLRKPTMKCGVCNSFGHFNDQCPEIQWEPMEDVDAIGFTGQRRLQNAYEPKQLQLEGNQRYQANQEFQGNQRYQPYQGNQNFQRSQNYQNQQPRQTNFQNNQQFRSQNSFGQGNFNQNQPNYQQNQRDSSLTDIVKTMAESMTQMQQHIHGLENQIGQIATSISKQEVQGRLPAQPEANPREHVNAITMLGGGIFEESATVSSRPHLGHDREQISQQKLNPHLSRPHIGHDREESGKDKVIPAPCPSLEKELEVAENLEAPKLAKCKIPVLITPAPFPSRLVRPKKEEDEDDTLDVFRKSEKKLTGPQCNKVSKNESCNKTLT